MSASFECGTCGRRIYIDEWDGGKPPLCLGLGIGHHSERMRVVD